MNTEPDQTMPRAPLIAVILATLAMGAPAAVRAGGETCIADWSVAAGVVRKEGLITVEQLLQLAKKSGAGDIVRTTLCEGGGSFVYRIVVKDGKGQLKSIVVDARKPFAR